MPRTARLDAPGVLHHVIIRGIERRKIFKDDQDREGLLKRLAALLPETRITCYAWSLMSIHAHFLFCTSDVSLSTLMQRLLTGYVVTFNRRHKRYGPLFRNRYKSILCQEDPYLRELVRYIHLNPLRARIVSTLSELNRYEYSGHGALMGQCNREWQEIKYERSNELQSKGYDLEVISKRVCELFGIEKEELYSGSRRQAIIDARGLFCYWAVYELGYPLTKLAEALGWTGPGIGYAVQRGGQLANRQ